MFTFEFMMIFTYIFLLASIFTSITGNSAKVKSPYLDVSQRDPSEEPILNIDENFTLKRTRRETKRPNIKLHVEIELNNKIYKQPGYLIHLSDDHAESDIILVKKNDLPPYCVALYAIDPQGNTVETKYVPTVALRKSDQHEITVLRLKRPIRYTSKLEGYLTKDVAENQAGMISWIQGEISDMRSDTDGVTLVERFIGKTKILAGQAWNWLTGEMC